MNTLTFDSRLKESELALLRQCIGLQIDYVSFVKGSCLFTEEQKLQHIECHKTFRITFSDSSNTRYDLDFTTLKGITPLPLPEQGKLELNLHIEPLLPLRERLKLPVKPDNIHGSLSFVQKETLVNIKIYGNHLRAMLNQIDDYIDLDYLKERHGLYEFPYIECDSIEVLILELSSGLRTYIRLDEYFIMVKPQTDLLEDDYFSDHSYFPPGQKKLQHEIGINH